MKALFVHGWTGHRRECPPAANGSQQTREICAVRSIAELVRITGASRSLLTTYGSETGNAEEISVALACPGIVFWRPLDHRGFGGWGKAK